MQFQDLPDDILCRIASFLLCDRRLRDIYHLMLTCTHNYYLCIPFLYHSDLFEVSSHASLLSPVNDNPRLSLHRPEIVRHTKRLVMNCENSWLQRLVSPNLISVIHVAFPTFSSLTELTLRLSADRLGDFLNAKAPSSITKLTLIIRSAKLSPTQCLQDMISARQCRFELKYLQIEVIRSMFSPQLPPLRAQFDLDSVMATPETLRCRVSYGIRSKRLLQPLISLKRNYCELTMNLCLGKIVLSLIQGSKMSLTCLMLEKLDAANVFMDYRDVYCNIPDGILEVFSGKPISSIHAPELRLVVLDVHSLLVADRWCHVFAKLNQNQHDALATICGLLDTRSDAFLLLTMVSFPLDPGSMWNFYRSAGLAHTSFIKTLANC